ncbi:hypothetical protein, partial [Streptomyces rochei]|uniref:hypothetical protein n=1 Tax=Streptomyces rochei TaxID=1928 RepID=UPI0036A904F7
TGNKGDQDLTEGSANPSGFKNSQEYRDSERNALEGGDPRNFPRVRPRRARDLPERRPVRGCRERGRHPFVPSAARSRGADRAGCHFPR